MKKLIAISIVLLFSGILHAQSCLPEGIVFTTQTQVDNFSINYPGCTEIEGNVRFTGGNFNNFNGLSVLTHIGGDLVFQGSYLPVDMEGLENLISVGGMFDINGNYGLTELAGLNNLTSIGGGLRIIQNRWLESLAALESLTEINGDLIIVSDSSLASLDGLENIDPSTIFNVSIFDNIALSECGMQSICDYLVNPNGVVDIYYNYEGCNTPVEIAEQCGISLTCLPYGNYHLLNQSEIDNFQTDYQNCSELAGLCEISGSDIVNLQGFEQVTSIIGSLRIIDNGSLISLSGLDNLDSVGGALFIHINPLLHDLSGLQNLETVGDGLYINFNDNLTSLEQLENLSSINGYLYILENANLTGLKGLDSINPLTISNIIIIYNDALSYCEVQSICEYLADPVGEVTIWENNTGCDSPAEIEAACNVGFKDRMDPGHQVIIYPNPASDVLFIESSERLESVCVFDSRGGKVEQWNGGTVERWNSGKVERWYGGKVGIPVGGLAPGIYLVRVDLGDLMINRKIIVKH